MRSCTAWSVQAIRFVLNAGKKALLVCTNPFEPIASLALSRDNKYLATILSIQHPGATPGMDWLEAEMDKLIPNLLAGVNGQHKDAREIPRSGFNLGT